MSRSAEILLEFDALRELLRRRTTCAPGRRAVDALAPGAKRDALEAAFALIREAREWLRAGRELGFGALADPEAWLAKLAPDDISEEAAQGAILDPAQLLDAASLIETPGWLKKQFHEGAEKFPKLAARAASLADFRELLAAIRKCILPNGEIHDDASPALRKLRANIAGTRESIQKMLKQILRSRGAEAGEDYVTLRNDRFVIPVRAENRRSVPGVVHGSSASGQTLFLEPLEALEVNNQLVQLTEEEASEITRILQDLTRRLQSRLAELRAAAEAIAELDSVFARARFAREFDAAIPEFSEAGALELDSARHPVLEDKLRREGRAVVPITLALGGEDRVLVISGPNTGGKTVALKTTGLAALAAQSGIPVAAQRAVVPMFDRVLVDIGDEQSIAADLSTFSAHMLNLKSMLEAATPRSLVLVDEMGTGTAPEEGAALAVALLEEFRAKRCLVLATTHHDRLKTYASTTAGVVNAAVEFDEVHLRPTYRLIVGMPGGSSGISIAQRLGLAAEIIERARKLLAPEALEAADLIAYLHRSRDVLDRMHRQMADERGALEEERKKLRTEWVERQQKRIAELELKFAEMQKRFDENVARVVEAVKEHELRAQMEKTARRKIQDARGEAREDLNAAVVQTLSDSQVDLGITAPVETVSAERLVPGARLLVKGFRQPVVLRRLDGSSAEVEAGPLRMKVAVEEITGIAGDRAGRKVTQEHKPRGITVHAQPGEGAATDEINVIGLTVEEASQRVDKFLDEAALANKPRFRIIHGHGTGALRKGLAKFLSTHPLVERHSFETEDRGGKAITVVELRR
ncbi:MAG TPA: endonuclease MutS2 [Candidatus Acidoferrales bacterium]|nr:endonuclease MutS2 [Candidatus Acidoferrales bacterium]